MKNLTKLQIFMLMSLAVGSLTMHANDVSDFEAVTSQVDAAQNLQATVDVLEELEQSNPDVIELIILDEADLEATFGSIRNFIQKKNKEIERLLSKNQVEQAEIAKLGIELADAQAAYEKASARYKMKHKKSYRGEQAIKDSLIKAEQGLQSLSSQIKNNLEATYRSSKKAMKKVVAQTTRPKKQSKKMVVESEVLEPMVMIEPMKDDMIEEIEVEQVDLE
ncbi:hypothetical protein KBC04_05225 [Candidatus Babeliales bacterium]|nr:hypothetical protein [Candidatus Babeliales bacterium]MBP9844147.1 hypothetical protein [Candidatus Babeliales bacterium]